MHAPSSKLWAVSYINVRGEPNVRYYAEWGDADWFSSMLRRRYGQPADVYMASIEWDAVEA